MSLSGMKRSASMQSNLSVHTNSTSGSTQRFESSSESLALADSDEDDMSFTGSHAPSYSGSQLPLAPAPWLTPGQMAALRCNPPASLSSLAKLSPDPVPLPLDLICEDGILGQGSTGDVRISSCGRVAWKMMTPAGRSSRALPVDPEPHALNHPHRVVSSRPLLKHHPHLEAPLLTRTISALKRTTYHPCPSHESARALLH